MPTSYADFVVNYVAEKVASDLEITMFKGDTGTSSYPLKFYFLWFITYMVKLRTEYEQAKNVEIEKQRKAGNEVLLKQEIDSLAQEQELAVRTQEVINATAVNLNEEANVKKEEADQKYYTTTTDNAKKSEDDVLAYRLSIVNKYIALASEALSTFNESQVAGFAGIVDNSLSAISSLLELSGQEFDKSFEGRLQQIASYAAAIGGAINGIISSFIAQNQAQLDAYTAEQERVSNENRDRFQAEANAGIEAEKLKYEQNLINQEQYSAAVEAINGTLSDKLKNEDKVLNDKLRNERKKAYKQEQNLKIAQATVSGLQGAVQAFAAAMQLGPIAGPIVGGLLAASVLTLTGVNIDKIKKTKFDEGSTVTPTSTDLPQTGGAVASSALNQIGGGFTSFNQNVTGTPTGTGTTSPFTPAMDNRVYVLESDITATQNRVRVLENNSTFG